MKYRREIDGLRALAVIPVVLFHAGFESFRGGYVGVDIFFVISGYLISVVGRAELSVEREREWQDWSRARFAQHPRGFAERPAGVGSVVEQQQRRRLELQALRRKGIVDVAQALGAVRARSTVWKFAYAFQRSNGVQATDFRQPLAEAGDQTRVLATW
jgi:hypothetical protein